MKKENVINLSILKWIIEEHGFECRLDPEAPLDFSSCNIGADRFRLEFYIPRAAGCPDGSLACQIDCVIKLKSPCISPFCFSPEEKRVFDALWSLQEAVKEAELYYLV